MLMSDEQKRESVKMAMKSIDGAGKLIQAVAHGACSITWPNASDQATEGAATSSDEAEKQSNSK